MAKFEMLGQEGMNFVKITIVDEMVQAERGALCWMTGGIEMDAKIPFIGRAIASYLSEEAFIRPTYTGTGEIYLESSFAGFHVIEVGDDTWILENGVYWASEGSVELGVRREKMLTSFWAGEGFIDWQTRLSGPGLMVITTPGPVDNILLEEGHRLVANGKYVLGRTESVSYRIQRSARTFIGTHISGEGYCRVYEGPGRILLSSVPYWRYRLFSQQPALPPQPAAVE
jgi:uncharacterized protein (AIM24 family)